MKRLVKKTQGRGNADHLIYPEPVLKGPSLKQKSKHQVPLLAVVRGYFRGQWVDRLRNILQKWKGEKVVQSEQKPVRDGHD